MSSISLELGSNVDYENYKLLVIVDIPKRDYGKKSDSKLDEKVLSIYLNMHSEYDGS